MWIKNRNVIHFYTIFRYKYTYIHLFIDTHRFISYQLIFTPSSGCNKRWCNTQWNEIEIKREWKKINKQLLVMHNNNNNDDDSSRDGIMNKHKFLYIYMSMLRLWLREDFRMFHLNWVVIKELGNMNHIQIYMYLCTYFFV